MNEQTSQRVKQAKRFCLTLSAFYSLLPTFYFFNVINFCNPKLSAQSNPAKKTARMRQRAMTINEYLNVASRDGQLILAISSLASEKYLTSQVRGFDFGVDIGEVVK